MCGIRGGGRGGRIGEADQGVPRAAAGPPAEAGRRATASRVPEVISASPPRAKPPPALQAKLGPWRRPAECRPSDVLHLNSFANRENQDQ